jgi:hypothetical protein
MLAKTLKLAAAGMLLGGCAATTTIDEFRTTTAPIEIGSDDRVVILGRRDAGHYETDRDFVDCVGNKMNSNKFTVMPEQEFIDAIYPWFEPRTAPRGLARLTRLLEEPLVRRKVDQEKIRYLVWLDGQTETQGQAGSMSCTLGPAGGGCLGFSLWEKASVYEAIIWDLQDLTEKARVRVDSEGTSYLIGVIAPIPLLSPVKSDACSGLGKQLKSYFVNGEAS